MTNFLLQQHFAELNDEALLRILTTETQNHTQEALAVARREAQGRGLSIPEIPQATPEATGRSLRVATPRNRMFVAIGAGGYAILIALLFPGFFWLGGCRCLGGLAFLLLAAAVMTPLLRRTQDTLLGERLPIQRITITSMCCAMGALLALEFLSAQHQKGPRLMYLAVLFAVAATAAYFASAERPG